MWFGYAPEIVEQFPEIAAAVVWVDSFANVRAVPGVEAQLAESERLTRERCSERSAIAQQAPVAAWRNAYSRMGLKPNRYPCATEQLMRRLVDGQPIPRIAALVDLCNAAALRFMIPVAPFNLDRVERFCEVRYAAGGERFWPINASEPDIIPEGEVIFADASPEVISRRWAWRQSDKGKITPETRRVVIVAEAMHDGGRDTAREIGRFLESGIRNLLDGEARVDIVDATVARSEYPSVP
jgi:DNA/RNA-binding domain of Phe-tRNA-synthetase-like protein